MEKNSRARKSMAVKDDCEEVSSIKWEFINMTQQEEDLIYRMYRLVGAKPIPMANTLKYQTGNILTGISCIDTHAQLRRAHLKTNIKTSGDFFRTITNAYEQHLKTDMSSVICPDGMSSRHMTDLIRWGLIAGRIPGRTAEEIERFWLMRHEKAFAERSGRRK